MSDPVQMALAGLATVMAAAAIAAPGTSHQAPRTHLAARDLVAAINVVRTAHHLRPLRIAKPLNAAADVHSLEMGEKGYFRHTSFDGTSFWKRVGHYYRSDGYSYWGVGENLLWSSATLTPAAAVKMWMKSPPHRRNLLDKSWRQVGLSAREFESAPGVFQGLSVTIVTADFGVRY